jgi:hypothetical protein
MAAARTKVGALAQPEAGALVAEAGQWWAEVVAAAQTKVGVVVQPVMVMGPSPMGLEVAGSPLEAGVVHRTADASQRRTRPGDHVEEVWSDV